MVENEHWAGAQDGSKLSSEVRTSSGKLGQIASDMETDTVLKKEDITDMVSQIEAAKEEANTEMMERIKIGLNKICIRNDLAKKNMMFSQESCQAIIAMGNVELIGLKKSRVQRPSCLHNVFEGTIMCSCGKHIRSNQEMIQRSMDAARKKDRTFANIWDRWENDLEYRKFPKKLVGTMRLCDISTTSYRLISLTKRLLNNDADIANWYVYVV